jgi:hypothetical protein
MSDLTCPVCRNDGLVRSDGRLDQSGESYVPTVVHRCPRCEYARFEPAVRAKWVPAFATVTEVRPASSLAAAIELAADALAA